MKFDRHYTKESWNTPYDAIPFEARKSEIKNPDGSKVFSISLPVQVFGTESNLSLLLGSFRFAPLLLTGASKLPPL
jgi:hypothetical protein